MYTISTTTLLTLSSFLAAIANCAALPSRSSQQQIQTQQSSLAADIRNPHNPASNGFRIPTLHESTVMARRLLQLSDYGTLSTIFPDLNSISPIRTTENRPSDVANLPFGLPEYIATCEPDAAYNPTILQVDIANTYRNAAAGSNVTLSVPWTPPGRRDGEFSAAQMPRVAVVGWLQEIFPEAKDGDVGAPADGILDCWLKVHPDTIWYPGSDIHVSRWVRFVSEEVYWFGGFGDRARIQWLDIDEFRAVTADEIEEAWLPGEREGDDVGRGRFSPVDSSGDEL